MSGSQTLVLKASGIHTNNNYYSAPVGSLAEAVNVVADRTDIIEPRRGLTQYGAEDDFATKQLLQYKDTVIKHLDSNLAYDFDDNGTFVDFTGDSITEVETGVRLKYVEMNGNLYFTTAAGVKKISALTKSDFATIDIVKAGAIKAVDITVTVNYDTFGFLEPNSKVAYKMVIGKKDINANLLLGVPSARTVVWNVGSVGCATTLKGILPSDVDDTYFVQWYRTGLSTETSPTVEPADPGDEMYLVIENTITATDISNGYVSTPDITSEDFRRNGALLYVNPVSGEGVLQANDVPPFCKDMTEYTGYMFYVNTASVQRLNLAFLTVLGITVDTDTFSVTDGTSTTTYTFRGDFETTDYSYNSVALASDFYNAAPATAQYFTLISAGGERKYAVWFKKNAVNDLAPSVSGYINIEVDITSGLLTTSDQFMQAAKDAIEAFTTDFNLTLNTTSNVLTVECSNNGAVIDTPVFTVALSSVVPDGNGTGDEGSDFDIFLPRTTGANAPDVGSALEQVSKSLVKKINAFDALVNAYYLSSSNDIPGQFYLENRNQTAPAFWVNSSGPQVPPNSIFNPAVPSTGKTIISTNEIRPNRASFSKYQQPEAVPLVNFLDIGPKDRAIKRVLALRDSLFFLKEDAIYRLSGNSSSNFSISPFDSSVQILAPDTAVVLNNQIYAMSTQGVVVITDTGVSIISRPIEDQILNISRSITAYKTASFGVPYESDRSYLLWTVRTPNDTVATQCFRYNTFTNTWTKWLGSKTCGLVAFADNKLYMGAGDINIIEKERKDLVRSDHCDRQYNQRIQAVGNKYIILDNFTHLGEGDLIQQRQYLTAQQFDRALRKLDLDTLVPSTDYYDTFHMVAGINPRTYVVNLADRLTFEIGIIDWNQLIDNYTYTLSTISQASQTVINLGPHDIQAGRYVNITGSNSTPSIDGIHKVIAADATTITIDFEVTVAGTTGVVTTDVNNFKDVQACFNLLIAELNVNDNVGFHDYLPSVDFMDLEESVTTFDRLSNKVVTKFNQKFFVGECTLYKAIDTYVVYNPQMFSDPSVEKQVRQFSALYEHTNFSKVIAGFKTDKSAAEAQVTITKGGIGDFGQFAWGAVSFGGVNAPTPLLTYVPMQKQRCRFMQVALRHKVAQEHYSLLGVALTYRPYSIKTTK